jgi:hypothetical protein
LQKSLHFSFELLLLQNNNNAQLVCPPPPPRIAGLSKGNCPFAVHARVGGDCMEAKTKRID